MIATTRTTTAPATRAAARARWIPIAVVLMAIAAPVSAQDLSEAHYTHDTWQTEQGLPQNTVGTIIQTRDGYLWLSTQEGLVRFDGVRFVVFDKRNTKQFEANHILALFEARDASLWIGTLGGGLLRYRDGQFTHYGAPQGLPALEIAAIAQDSRGALWFGSTNRGLFRLDDRGFTNWTTRDGLAHNSVTAIQVDPEDGLWIATVGGLSRFVEGKFRSHGTGLLAGKEITALRLGRAGELWLGTREGLMRLDRGELSTFTTRDGLASNVIRTIYQDAQGAIFIGSSGGLNRFAEGRVSEVIGVRDLSGERVAAVLVDREGSIWIGTEGGGLNRLRYGRIAAFGSAQGLPDENVYTLAGSARGGIWTGTFSGVVAYFKDDRFDVLPLGGQITARIRTILEDRTGGIWLGTDDGVYCYRGSRLTSYVGRLGLPTAPVRSVFQDRNGDIWVGTDSGAARLHDGRFTAYTSADGLGDGRVRAFHQSPDGTLWIATYGGLSHLQNGRLTTLTTANGLSTNFIRSIYEDADGTLWLGTYGGGLNRIEDGVITAYREHDGLFNDAIFQVIDDGRGNLWMSCNRGLFRVSKTELIAFAERKIARITSVAYDEGDGMRSRECNGGNPGAWRSRDGQLWFPTLKGIVAVQPHEATLNQLAPPVVIEALAVDRKAVPLAGTIDLPSGHGDLEFIYTGLSFLDPGTVAFKFMLEGYDADWVDAGARRSAYYTNIRPGTYRFRVIARNADGVWNQTGASIALRLRPHVYQTWWFYGLCAAIVVGVALSLYGRRIAGLKARELTLQRTVDERTAELELSKRAAESANSAKSGFLASMSHEIRTPMNAIGVTAELMAGTALTDEQRDYLETLQLSTDSLLSLVNEVLDFSKIEAGRLDLDRVEFSVRDTLHQTTRSLAGRAQQRGVELLCHVKAEVPDELVGDPGRLRQVVVNLVGNALKFTERGEIRIEAALDTGETADENIRLHVRVVDTGIGIAADKQATIFEAFEQAHDGIARQYGGTGLGLAISANLVRLMGGKIWVESVTGAGSTFHFTVTLGRGALVASPPPSALGDVRVLVADSNPSSLRMLEEVLAGWGMKPVTVTGGHAALAELAQARDAGQPFRLALLDARLHDMDGFAVAARIDQHAGLVQAIVLMVSSANQSDSVARCGALGLRFIVKPIDVSPLRTTLVAALDRNRAPDAAGPAPAERGARTEAAAGPLRILVAEDNPVNQKLAMQVLGKFGHHATLVGNGQEAIDAVACESFDMILMDLQMPEIGGLEATSIIRARERETKQHVPIVAMTAHALKGDRERCLRAGMDEYIPKPIRIADLRRVIDTVTGRAPSQAQDAPVANRVFDLEGALARTGGEMPLLGELSALFVQEAQPGLVAVREAVARRDAPGLERELRLIEGSLQLFGAAPALEAVRALEMRGRVTDMEGAGQAIGVLEDELSRLQSALADLVQAQ